MEVVMQPSPIDLRTGGSGLHDICIPLRTGVLIYRSNYNGTLFLAFEDLATNTVKELKWNVRKSKFHYFLFELLNSLALRIISNVSISIGSY